jgi:peptide-methionine (S)-S-oxide reductase
MIFVPTYQKDTVKKINYIASCFLFGIALLSCAQTKTKEATIMKTDDISFKDLDTATFGAGCFWCVEAVYQQVKGVVAVSSGYSGGTVKNPSYKDVCTGTTGHAEVTQVFYDPKQVSFEQLLEVFWKVHDPTTLNRQGNDVGTQYRSVIFYHTAKQKELAEKYKKELAAAGAWDKPIVTEISPFTIFYKAEDYHQNYYNLNGSEPYCQFVIKPKLDKFEKVFKGKLMK